MELNEQSTYLPYVLGRLFSVLEAVQQSASPNLTSTIKSRYFNSASATPSLVFPTLINLAQKPVSYTHLFNPYACIASAGATSEDTTLPMILRYSNEETVVVSVLNGIICSFFVPILLSLCFRLP